MEREKRQIKAPQGYIIPKVCYPRIRKKKAKKKPLEQASYQVIPAPIKFVYTNNCFALYGVKILSNIPLFPLSCNLPC